MKKECENVTLYFYGELDQEEMTAFKAHLPHCPLCQKELSFLENVQTALVPPAAPQNVVNAVLAQTKKVSFWQKIFRPALGIGAALAAGVFFLVMGPNPSQTAPDNTDWLAYVSVQSDEDFNNFAQEFEIFENEF
ncbi:MAG: zf-HC2 domain-containing protein [Elusimicrobiaceae bacterium]|nr:zf-HC2 domain-containing protein [Elusimicrobiaceae bacterium]